MKAVVVLVRVSFGLGWLEWLSVAIQGVPRAWEGVSGVDVAFRCRLFKVLSGEVVSWLVCRV